MAGCHHKTQNIWNFALQEIKKYQDTIQKLENNYCSNNVIITFNLLGLRCKLKVKMCDSHLKLPVFNK